MCVCIPRWNWNGDAHPAANLMLYVPDRCNFRYQSKGIGEVYRDESPESDVTYRCLQRQGKESKNKKSNYSSSSHMMTPGSYLCWAPTILKIFHSLVIFESLMILPSLIVLNKAIRRSTSDFITADKHIHWPSSTKWRSVPSVRGSIHFDVAHSIVLLIKKVTNYFDLDKTLVDSPFSPPFLVSYRNSWV